MNGVARVHEPQQCGSWMMAWFSVLSCIWLCAALARLLSPLAAASTPSRAAKPMIKAPLYSLQLLPVCRCREPGAARPLSAADDAAAGRAQHAGWFQARKGSTVAIVETSCLLQEERKTLDDIKRLKASRSTVQQYNERIERLQSDDGLRQTIVKQLETVSNPEAV